MNELNTQDSNRAVAASLASPASPVSPTKNAGPDRPAAREAGKALPPQGEVLPATPAPEADRSVDEAVVALNDYVQNIERNIRFTFDDDLGRSIVSVVDSETEQVIRQIPNDVVVRLARNLKTELEESLAPVVGTASASGTDAPGNSPGGALSFIDTTA